MFDKASLIDHIGDFVNDNMLSALDFLIGSFGTDNNFPFAGSVSGANAGFSHNDTAGGEVRAFNAFHKVIQSTVGVFNQKI